MAAVDYFLKIDGIKGESTDSKHKDEIDVESFSWGASQSATPVGGGGGAGKVQVQDFHFVMRTNKASPTIFFNLASGTHIKQAVLYARKAGKDQLEFLKLAFSDILISSYQTGGSQDVVPTDQVSINFAKIEFEYRPQKADGTLDAAVTASWDVKANKAV